VALIGTGVNPGFVMDKLVVTLAAVFAAHRPRESVASSGTPRSGGCRCRKKSARE